MFLLYRGHHLQKSRAFLLVGKLSCSICEFASLEIEAHIPVLDQLPYCISRLPDKRCIVPWNFGFGWQMMDQSCSAVQFSCSSTNKTGNGGSCRLALPVAAEVFLAKCLSICTVKHV